MKRYSSWRVRSSGSSASSARRRRGARSRRCSTGGPEAAGERMGRRAGNAAPPGLHDRAHGRRSRRCRPGRSPSRRSAMSARRRVSSARRRRRPRGARATTRPSLVPSTRRVCRGPMRRRRPVMRWTPSRSHSAESAPTTSSLNAIWASGAPLFASKWRWGGRTASCVLAVHDRHRADRLAPSAQSPAQAPTRSSSRRGPSAIATVRKLGCVRSRRGRRIDDARSRPLRPSPA